MSWRLALSLEELRNEVNARWPAREKASDGTIGDAAHAAAASDHNPNAAGVVCAFDITHDPNGPDGNDLAERLRRRRHPDAKYIIWNGRICSAYARGAALPWEWRPYSGADPHTNHVHVSVGVGPDGQSQPPYDDADSWLVDTAPEEVPMFIIRRPSDGFEALLMPARWIHLTDGNDVALLEAAGVKIIDGLSDHFFDSLVAALGAPPG